MSAWAGPCPARAATFEPDDSRHCVHPTGNVVVTLPPKQEVQCCFCGEKFLRTYEQMDNPDGHGPFHPMKVRV